MFKGNKLKKECLKVSQGFYGTKDNPKIIYGSFHHSKFTMLNAQRNTEERFKIFKIESLEGKKVLDLGCNTGAISVMASMKGGIVHGMDNSIENIRFCIELMKYLGYTTSFYVKDIDLVEGIMGYDVIFCLALNAWVDEENLIRMLSESNAETIYWESNKGDKTIPGYDCEFVGKDAGRFNYICRKFK